MKKFLRLVASIHLVNLMFLSKFVDLPAHIDILLFSTMPIDLVFIDMLETGLTLKIIMGNPRRAVPFIASLAVFFVCAVFAFWEISIPETICDAADFKGFVERAVVIVIALLACVHIVIVAKDATRHNEGRPLY